MITDANYEESLIELERLMDLQPEPGTPEAAQLDALAKKLFEYEEERFGGQLVERIVGEENI